MVFELLTFSGGAALVALFVFFLPFVAPEVRRRRPIGLGRFFTSRRRRIAYALMAVGIGIGISLAMTLGSAVPYVVVAASLLAWGFFMWKDESDEERQQRNRH